VTNDLFLSEDVLSNNKK